MSDLATQQRVAGASSVIVIHGRKVVPGVAEGEALVTRDRISGWGGIDSRTGTIVETRHELRPKFRGQGAGVPGRQGVFRLVRRVPPGAPDERGTGSFPVQ